MKYVAQTVTGIEDIAIGEIKETINAKAKKVIDGRLLFSTTKINKLVYVTGSISRIYRLLTDFNFSTLDEIKAEAKKLNLKAKQSFAVRCERQGSHSFTSQEIEKAVGSVVDGNVNLDNPSVVIFVDIINGKCFIGIEPTKQLHRRDYRVKASSRSVNPTVAYAMVRLSGWKKNGILLDPFCMDGVIAIEAALYASGIPRGYFSMERIKEVDKGIKHDKLNIFAYDSLHPNVRGSEINAKLAGVNKLINFSKIELDWLDVKLDKESVDAIVTALPSGEDREMEKIYKEFFHQANFVLKKDGKIVVAAQKPGIVERHAENFRLEHERKVSIGGLTYAILVFVRQAA